MVVAELNVSLKDANIDVEMLDSISCERHGMLINNSPVTDDSLNWEAV